MPSRRVLFSLLPAATALLACATPRAAQAPAPAVALPAATAPAPTAPPAQAPAPPPRAESSAGVDPFVSSIRPMLATSCTPCHVPGGKMYDRLPFDDADVVRSHSGGILRRLKDEKRVAFETWLASLP